MIQDFHDSKMGTWRQPDVRSAIHSQSNIIITTVCMNLNEWIIRLCLLCNEMSCSARNSYKKYAFFYSLSKYKVIPLSRNIKWKFSRGIMKFLEIQHCKTCWLCGSILNHWLKRLHRNLPSLRILDCIITSTTYYLRNQHAARFSFYSVFAIKYCISVNWIIEPKLYLLKEIAASLGCVLSSIVV